MSNLRDGAANSLDRQLDMLRFIRKAEKKGANLTEIQFYMTARHGLSDEWVIKYMKKWSKFHMIQQKGNRYTINEDRWELMQKMRDQDDIFEE